MDGWTDDELAAAVDAYKQMMRNHNAGDAYNKREVYRILAARFHRTDKAFEYRMQNISAVLAEMGEAWLPGLKPAGNVGKHVGGRIRDMLSRPDFPDALPFPTPATETLPSIRKSTLTTVFARDPEVVREVKRRAADGQCECCGELGFETDSGYYLEAHHVIPLNCDGPDVVWNVVAICSNDHKRAHFAKDRTAVRDGLIDVLGRLYPDRHCELQALARNMDALPNVADQLEADSIT